MRQGEMKRLMATAVLLFGFATSQTATEENSRGILLPSPKLLRCRSSECSQLWLEKSGETSPICPKQLILDMNQGCLYGLTALYEKSIPAEEVMAAIDARYEKSSLSNFANSSLRLWRIEPDKFAIQMSVADKADEKKHITEAGTTRVIYIAFGGASACDTH